MAAEPTTNDLSLQIAAAAGGGATGASLEHINEIETIHQPNCMESMSDIGLVSSMSDISSASKKYGKGVKHDRTECLQCSRKRTSRLNSRINSDVNISRKKSLDVSYNSPESVFSEDSAVADRTSAKIMQHVQRMGNFGWIKQSKQALLELKQKHPQSFQDMCLYSEVCKALGRNTYRAATRRFIQELFYDLDFDSFYVDCNEILTRKESLADEILEIVEDTPQEVPQPIPQLPPNTFKHFKSPALASVYEASAENLSESLKSKSQVPTDEEELTTTSANNTLLSTSSSNNSRTKNLPNHPQTTETANLNTSNSNYQQLRQKNHMRPRFNTLELDLSCTKNKFPIRDRSKLARDYSRGGEGASTASAGDCLLSPTEDLQPLSTSMTPIGSLYCEQRLFKSSRSEQTLTGEGKRRHSKN